MVVTFEGQDYGYLYPRARRPEGNESHAPMNPIACLFLDRAHREPERAVVEVRDIHTGVEVQVATAVAIVRHSRPIAAAVPNAVQRRTNAVAVARGRVSKLFLNGAGDINACVAPNPAQDW